MLLQLVVLISFGTIVTSITVKGPQTIDGTDFVFVDQFSSRPTLEIEFSWDGGITDEATAAAKSLLPMFHGMEGEEKGVLSEILQSSKLVLVSSFRNNRTATVTVALGWSQKWKPGVMNGSANGKYMLWFGNGTTGVLWNATVTTALIPSDTL
eukprot:PhF_6_TR10586/c0_g3_i3/m.16947